VSRHDDALSSPRLSLVVSVRVRQFTALHGVTCKYLHFWTSTLALPWIFVLGQRFDHYECGRLSWLGQLYGAL